MLRRIMMMLEKKNNRGLIYVYMMKARTAQINLQLCFTLVSP
jgi:hypothetical protein